MKMAKASKDDIQRCIKFFQLIDEYFEEGTYTPSDTDEPERLTDSDFVDRLREMWGGRLCRAGVDCSWMRVVFGCGILIDSVCDPAKDVLELRPDLASAAAAKAECERLRVFERAMESMAAQMIHPKMTALEMANMQLEEPTP